MTERTRQYLASKQKKLDALQAMWRDPRVQLYNDEDLPAKVEFDSMDSVFLAGPTSRNQILECNWRCEAVALLRTCGFHGWIFCPEPRGQELASDFTERSYTHEWESNRLMNATHVAFWIPRKADELIGLNTNLELGIFLGMGISKSLDGKKLFVGWPNHAERMGLPTHYAKMAGFQAHSELMSLCKAVADSKTR